MNDESNSIFESTNLSDKRILIIDDDEAVRKVLRKMLEGLSAQVEEAEDGEQGIRKYQEGIFNLIVTDMIMPCKEGIQVIQELRRKHPEVAIIAISGGGEGASMDYLKWAKMLGARACLPKPIQKKDFINTVLDNLK